MKAEVLRLCEAVRTAGGRAMLVGGWVRDKLLGIDSQDFDIEVYHLDPAHLRKILEQVGSVNVVGEHFAVYKVVVYPQPDHTPPLQAASADVAARESFEIDVSLPRRESKSGRGHRGFVIEGDPQMSFEEAARRRDFTINAMLYDPLTREAIDPYNGREDLKQRILRAVAADTFIEDSLRVLRAVQFAARFKLSIEPDTVALCRRIELSDLPRERIWGEIEKLLTGAEQPSIGLDVALELGVFEKLFPEFLELVAIPSSETLSVDRFTHTKQALDAAKTLVANLSRPRQIAVLLATLCHDLRRSPVATTEVAAESLERTLDATRSILSKLGLFGIGGYDVRSQVLALVAQQLKPREFHTRVDSIGDGEFRRLASVVELNLLYRVSRACSMANQEAQLAEEWFIDKARSLGVEHSAPAPFLQGRHLIDAGFEPGPKMGSLLKRVYELQLDGRVTTSEEGLSEALRLAETSPDLFR